MAAIITTQTPTNQPSVPSAVPGPASIPRMRSTVDHQASPASANRRVTSSSLARAAANAGARPACPPGKRVEAAELISRGPGEVRLREARPALVRDPEGVDPRARRPRHRELGAGRMENAREPGRLARLDAERDDVLDLEVDRVPDLHAVAQPLLVDVDRGARHAEVLGHERPERLHRP